MRYQQLVTALVCVVMLTPAVASAQPRVEVSGIAGWTLSDGVETGRRPRAGREHLRRHRHQGLVFVGLWGGL